MRTDVRVLPPHICFELYKAGYPQGDSQLVWVKGGGGENDWDLVERHEAPSADNRISAMTRKEADTWTDEQKYLTPDQCEEIRSEGYIQGRSKYLWHKDKQYGWVLYKRNNNDMSQYADKFGYNRWVSAVTHDEAEGFRAREAARPRERTVDFMTFRAGDVESPRQSACEFATKYGDRLINICETYPSGYTNITVYYWKEE